MASTRRELPGDLDEVFVVVAVVPPERLVRRGPYASLGTARGVRTRLLKGTLDPFTDGTPALASETRILRATEWEVVE